MAFSTDVQLAAGQAPKFPPQCIVCGAFDPESSVELRTRGLWDAGQLKFLLRLFTAAVRIQAPACVDCGARLRRQRATKRWLRAVGVAAGGAAIAVVLDSLRENPWLEWLGGELQTVLAVVAALLILLPIEYFLAPALDVTVRSGRIEYEFRDRSYAEDFARLNGTEVED